MTRNETLLTSAVALALAAGFLGGCVVRERTYVTEDRPAYVEPPPPGVVYAPAPQPGVAYAPAPGQPGVVYADPPPPNQVVIVGEAPPDRVLVVRRDPPPAVQEAIPRSPGREFMWVPGYWVAQRDRWVWVSGRWQRPPHPGAVWVPSRWERRNDGFHMTLGFWR